MNNQNNALTFLNDQSLFSSQGISLDQVLDMVLNSLVNIFGMKASLLFLGDIVSGHAFVSSRCVPVNLFPDMEKRFSTNKDTNWPQTCAQSLQTLVFENLAEDGHFSDVFDEAEQYSCIYFPLRAKNKVFGVICLVAGEANPITGEDEFIFETLGIQIGLLIDGYLVTQGATRCEREALTLYQMGTKFGDVLDEVRILKAAAESARFILAADVGIIASLDDERDELTIRAISERKHIGMTGLRIPLSVGQSRSILAQRKPILFDQVRTSLPLLHESRWITEYGFAAYLGMPLIYQGHPTGIIGVLFYNLHWFTPEEIRTLRRLSSMIVYPLGSAFQFKRGRSLGAVEERRRLARELHDHIAQELSYVHMKISATEDHLSNRELDLATQDLQYSKRILNGAYEDLREIILNLRTPIISGQNFIDGFAQYLEEYKSHYGLPVHMKVETLRPISLPDDISIQVSSIIQEALANVRKHAKSREIQIKIERPANWLVIAVSDDGVGFDLEKVTTDKQQGIGLQVMKERAESIEAHLTISSKVGKGTVVSLEIPLDEEE